jgi:hypothetical protein
MANATAMADIAPKIGTTFSILFAAAAPLATNQTKGTTPSQYGSIWTASFCRNGTLP